MIAQRRVELPGGAFEILVDGPAGALARGPEDGPASAEVVLCLHGFPDLPRGFESLLVALADAGYCAVAPWMRGYAPSTLEGPYDPDQLANDVLELADALSPRRPVCVIGHDWGAVATYAALVERPDRFRRAVTLAVPHPVAFALNLPRDVWQWRRSRYMALMQIPRVAERRVAADDFAYVERLWHAWSPGYVPPRVYLDEIKRTLALSFPAPIAYYRALGWHPLRAAAWARRLAHRPILVPTLHLQGAEDGCIRASLGAGQRRFFAAEHHSEVLLGAGHFLHLEQPALVNARVLAWLAS